jgi:exosome complex RNA-binding protein Rrp42 (RNase PH superfamily)
LLAVGSVPAQSPAAQRGLTFVRVHCAQCHSNRIDATASARCAAWQQTRRRRFIEHRGYDNRIGEDGFPTDPRHPYYTGRLP